MLSTCIVSGQSLRGSYYISNSSSQSERAGELVWGPGGRLRLLPNFGQDSCVAFALPACWLNSAA